MDGPIDTLSALPQAARRLITFDRATEVTDWPYLQAGLGVQTRFCDPQSPWQKGSVENTNRGTRKWLPRDLDPLSINDHDLKDICDHAAQIPRLQDPVRSLPAKNGDGTLCFGIPPRIGYAWLFLEEIDHGS